MNLYNSITYVSTNLIWRIFKIVNRLNFLRYYFRLIIKRYQVIKEYPYFWVFVSLYLSALWFLFEESCFWCIELDFFLSKKRAFKVVLMLFFNMIWFQWYLTFDFLPNILSVFPSLICSFSFPVLVLYVLVLVSSLSETLFSFCSVYFCQKFPLLHWFHFLCIHMLMAPYH